MSSSSQPPQRPRRPVSARDAAESVFQPRSPVAEPAAPRAERALPNTREPVMLRIDRDVLEHFQEDGAGWQDRINAALRAAAGL